MSRDPLNRQRSRVVFGVFIIVVGLFALLDIGMPAMDGYELAAHLRFQPGCEELPIVAITGSGGPEDVRRSRAKGFSAHLVKPVSAASLLTLLK